MALSHLGTRVGVQTLEVHIESFYCLMNIPVPRHFTLPDGKPIFLAYVF